MNRAAGGFVAFLIIVVLIIVAVFAVGGFIGALVSINKTGPTTVSVVRNGGPFDTNSIRETRPPSSGNKISGLWSSAHDYIAGNEQRFYKISSDPSLGDNSGADYIKVPTKDGVNVTIDAQVSFRTDFTDESGNITPCDCESEAGEEEYPWLVDKFDTAYGNRNFASKTGGSHKPYEGNDGWNAFLDSIFRPVVENAFREQIGSVNCADLVSSCALVQSSNQEEVKITAQDNKAHFQEIQESVQTQLQAGVTSALGREYLTGFKVQLTKVTLPSTVQGAIDKAQASFADIATARAQKIQAQYQAEANEKLATAYKNNPILGYIKAVESLKDSTATIILGEPGTGLTLGK